MNFEETKERALCILDLRPHSRFELYRKLIQKGADEDIVNSVLDDLEDMNLINDAEFASVMIRHFIDNKNFGRHRIKTELAKRGISSDIIEIALDENETDEFDILYPLLETKLSGDFEKKSIDKAVRYFSSHGYGISDIFRCINLIKENSTD